MRICLHGEVMCDEMLPNGTRCDAKAETTIRMLVTSDGSVEARVKLPPGWKASKVTSGVLRPPTRGDAITPDNAARCPDCNRRAEAQ